MTHQELPQAAGAGGATKHVVEFDGAGVLWPRLTGILWGWGFGERVISCRVRCLVCGSRVKFWGLPDQIKVEEIATILPDCPGPSAELLARLVEG